MTELAAKYWYLLLSILHGIQMNLSEPGMVKAHLLCCSINSRIEMEPSGQHRATNASFDKKKIRCHRVAQEISLS